MLPRLETRLDGATLWVRRAATTFDSALWWAAAAAVSVVALLCVARPIWTAFERASHPGPMMAAWSSDDQVVRWTPVEQPRPQSRYAGWLLGGGLAAAGLSMVVLKVRRSRPARLDIDSHALTVCGRRILWEDLDSVWFVDGTMAWRSRDGRQHHFRALALGKVEVRWLVPVIDGLMERQTPYANRPAAEADLQRLMGVLERR